MFSIGFSNAYAKEAKTSKAKITTQVSFRVMSFNINLSSSSNIVKVNYCPYGSCVYFIYVVNSDGEVVGVIKACRGCVA